MRSSVAARTTSPIAWRWRRPREPRCRSASSSASIRGCSSRNSSVEPPDLRRSAGSTAACRPSGANTASDFEQAVERRGAGAQQRVARGRELRAARCGPRRSAPARRRASAGRRSAGACRRAAARPPRCASPAANQPASSRRQAGKSRTSGSRPASRAMSSRRSNGGGSSMHVPAAARTGAGTAGWRRPAAASASNCATPTESWSSIERCASRKARKARACSSMLLDIDRVAGDAFARRSGRSLTRKRAALRRRRWPATIRSTGRSLSPRLRRRSARRSGRRRGSTSSICAATTASALVAADRLDIGAVDQPQLHVGPAEPHRHRRRLDQPDQRGEIAPRARRPRSRRRASSPWLSEKSNTQTSAAPPGETCGSARWPRSARLRCEPRGVTTMRNGAAVFCVRRTASASSRQRDSPSPARARRASSSLRILRHAHRARASAASLSRPLDPAVGADQQRDARANSSIIRASRRAWRWIASARRLARRARRASASHAAPKRPARASSSAEQRPARCGVNSMRRQLCGRGGARCNGPACELACAAIRLAARARERDIAISSGSDPA